MQVEQEDQDKFLLLISYSFHCIEEEEVVDIVSFRKQQNCILSSNNYLNTDLSQYFHQITL